MEGKWGKVKGGRQKGEGKRAKTWRLNIRVEGVVKTTNDSGRPDCVRH
jgi:hypothetical protein